METKQVLKIVTHNGEHFTEFSDEKEKSKIISNHKHAHRIEEGTLTGNLFLSGEPKVKKTAKKKKADDGAE